MCFHNDWWTLTRFHLEPLCQPLHCSSAGTKATSQFRVGILWTAHLTALRLSAAARPVSIKKLFQCILLTFPCLLPYPKILCKSIKDKKYIQHGNHKQRMLKISPLDVKPWLSVWFENQMQYMLNFKEASTFQLKYVPFTNGWGPFWRSLQDRCLSTSQALSPEGCGPWIRTQLKFTWSLNGSHWQLHSRVSA